MHKMTIMVLMAALLAPLALGGSDQALAAYQEKAAALAGTDAAGHYLLALWCDQQGLEDQARLEFEKVISLEPDHRGARRGLGYMEHQGNWLTHDEAMRAKGLVKHEGVWMLPEEVNLLLLPEAEKERIREENARARKLLLTMAKGEPRVQRMAVKALAGIEDAVKVDPLAYALRYPAEFVRVYAAEELGRIKDRRALKPLVYRSLIDPSEAVRNTALASVAKFEDPNLLAPYVQAMFAESPELRNNAARAVAQLGDPRGIQYLVYRLSAHGGGHTRSHIYLATQISFIQDFDVEVAQTAFIADPIVGIVQEGKILDVRVIATSRDAEFVERKVIRGALKRMTGQDFGEDPVAWNKWWNENKAELLAGNN
jgi:HEAT repeats